MALRFTVKPYKQGATWYLRIPADIIKHTGLDPTKVEFRAEAIGKRGYPIRIYGVFRSPGTAEITDNKAKSPRTAKNG